MKKSNTQAARLNNMQDRLLKSIMTTRIYDLVRETPLSFAPNLSAATNNSLYLKREDMQRVFSFKLRGAYHKMTRISPARRRRGVVAASAGNHAQGVALAAQKLQCPATIVMPRHVQKIKAEAVQTYHPKIILHGDSFDEANQHAKRLASKKNAIFIPSFDDVDVIAGNGTIAAEILRQHPDTLHTIFCAIGGGGLISGIAVYAKALRPNIHIVGVESDESASMSASLRANRRVKLPRVGIFADAVAVKQPGLLTFAITKEWVDDVITVSNDEICSAIKDLYEDTRVIFEPSGALAIAGAKRYIAHHRLRQKNMVAVACGANMNFDQLRFVAERAHIGEQSEALFAVTIPERAGSLRHFWATLGQRSITEFSYRVDDRDEARVFVGIKIREASERTEICQTLRAAKWPTMDLTDDEMAKLHTRHLVGGRAQVEHEILYRFEFPEYPGALMRFVLLLDKFRVNWNISLFHYHADSSIGRVLLGIQIPPAERKLFVEVLKELGYRYHCETDNPAYRLFLQADSNNR